MLTTKTETTKQLESFLKGLLENKQNHAKWLNTLAFLEHIGCRKIVKSQNSALLSKDLLQHISEEARHAFYFKKLALKLNAEITNFKEENLLRGQDSEKYFQALDYKTADLLKEEKQSAFLNYLYTTWLVEERAVQLYTVYNQKLKAKQLPFNLDMILNEEDQHLNTVEGWLKKKDPQFKTRAKSLFHYESQEFSRLLEKWLSAVSS